MVSTEIMALLHWTMPSPDTGGGKVRISPATWQWCCKFTSLIPGSPPFAIISVRTFPPCANRNICERGRAWYEASKFAYHHYLLTEAEMSNAPVWGIGSHIDQSSRDDPTIVPGRGVLGIDRHIMSPLFVQHSFDIEWLRVVLVNQEAIERLHVRDIGNRTAYNLLPYSIVRMTQALPCCINMCKFKSLSPLF